MFISDLEHLQELSEIPALQGGVTENVISFSLSQGILSLRLNDKELFTTPYTSTPSSFVVSLEGTANLKSSYRVENVNGVAKSSWILSSGTSPSEGASSLFSFLSRGILI